MSAPWLNAGHRCLSGDIVLSGGVSRRNFEALTAANQVAEGMLLGRHSPCSVKAAFSLIELVMVMSIMGIIAVATLPAISSILNSEGVNQAVGDISMLLNQSRDYAMTHNTYVWIGFAPISSSQQLSVAVVSGTSGDVSDLGMGNVSPVGKIRTYNNLTLKDITGLTGMSASEDDILTSQVGTFQQTVRGSEIAFSDVLQFNPQGEATIDKTPGGSHWIQIGLQPIHGGNQTGANVAVFQVATLSGQLQIFRP